MVVDILKPGEDFTHLQIVWAAGLFEGEGCFRRSQPRGAASVNFGMRLVMSDRDVIDRYAAVVALVAGRWPAVTERKKAKQHHKQQYAVTIHGPDAEKVYRAIRPWLGERRRTRADAICAEVAAYHDPSSRRTVCEECGSAFVRPLGTNKRFCSSLCLGRARDRRPATRIARMRRYWASKTAGQESLL